MCLSTRFWVNLRGCTSSRPNELGVSLAVFVQSRPLDVVIRVYINIMTPLTSQRIFLLLFISSFSGPLSLSFLCKSESSRVLPQWSVLYVLLTQTIPMSLLSFIDFYIVLVLCYFPIINFFCDLESVYFRHY